MLATLNEREAKKVSEAERILEGRFRAASSGCEDSAGFATVMARLTLGGEARNTLWRFG